MNMMDVLLGSEAGQVVQQLGQQFGLDEQQTSSALAALVPALAAGFKHSASSASGMDALTQALGGGRHQQYIDDLQALGRADAISDGNSILGQIFGSKDVSREVAQRASTQTGLASDILKQMLPVVAAAMAGAIARRQFGGAQSQAGFAPRAGAQAGSGGLLDMLTPMLDANRDGTMVDDVIGMIGKYMSGR
jgi:hypothetical protein